MNIQKEFRVLVGTMYNRENDYDECLAMIGAQKGVQITQHIICEKNEYDAHLELYGHWKNVSHQYDVFAKIDADMILKDNTCILRASKELVRYVEQGFASISCPLYDFFLEDQIHGMHFYSGDISKNYSYIQKQKSKVFCDDIDVHEKSKTLFSKDESQFDVIPIGYHCKNPNEKQSFFWGFHRGTKGRNVYDKLMASNKRKPHPMKEIALYAYTIGKKYPNTLLTEDIAQSFINSYKK